MLALPSWGVIADLLAPPLLDRPVGPDAPAPAPAPGPTFAGTLIDPRRVRRPVRGARRWPPTSTTSRSRTAGGSGSRTWDRYGRGHPPGTEYPYILGRKVDPYSQNVLKGDYPVIGQHTFF